MTDKVGTDEYVDWRQSIFVYSETPITCHLHPNPDALTLIATEYHGPALPDNFERPSWVPDAVDGRTKRRKTDPGPGASAPVPTQLRLIPPQGPAAAPGPSTSQPPGYSPLIHPPANGQPAAAMPNKPAQNFRHSGSVFYPTHKHVPWDNQDMFSSFQVPLVNGQQVEAVNGSSSSVNPRPPQPAPGPRSSLPVTIPPPPPTVLATAPSAYVSVVPAKRDMPHAPRSPERSPKRPALASPGAVHPRPE